MLELDDESALFLSNSSPFRGCENVNCNQHCEIPSAPKKILRHWRGL